MQLAQLLQDPRIGLVFGAGILTGAGLFHLFAQWRLNKMKNKDKVIVIRTKVVNIDQKAKSVKAKS